MTVPLQSGRKFRVLPLRTPGEVLPGQEPNGQTGHAPKVAVISDERQTLLERRRRDQGIDVADQPWSVRRAEGAAQVGVAIQIQNGVGQGIGTNLLKLASKVSLSPGKVREAS